MAEIPPPWQKQIQDSLNQQQARVEPYITLFGRLHHLQHTLQENEKITDDAKRLIDVEKASTKCITELQTRILDLENQLAESKEVKDAQDKTIELIQSQSESLHGEMDDLTQRIRNLRAENESLVKRWVEKIEKEALATE